MQNLFLSVKIIFRNMKMTLDVGITSMNQFYIEMNLACTNKCYR